jgi:hypothetical protein
MLLSYEQTLVDQYRAMSESDRAAMLRAASSDPKTSGPLIQSYRAIDARAAILAAYDVDSHLVIRTPGKFEAESAWVPYFWESSLDGTADELNYPDGATLYVVQMDSSDRAAWPEIDADIVAAVLEESESGFVSCSLNTQEELAQQAECDAAQESEASDDTDTDLAD